MHVFFVKEKRHLFTIDYRFIFCNQPQSQAFFVVWLKIEGK